MAAAGTAAARRMVGMTDQPVDPHRDALRDNLGLEKLRVEVDKIRL